MEDTVSFLAFSIASEAQWREKLLRDREAINWKKEIKKSLYSWSDIGVKGTVMILGGMTLPFHPIPQLDRYHCTQYTVPESLVCLKNCFIKVGKIKHFNWFYFLSQHFQFNRKVKLLKKNKKPLIWLELVFING